MSLGLNSFQTALGVEAVTVTYSNITIDKTSISIGQVLNVTFDMSSTGLSAGMQPNVFLELADLSSECEEQCGTSIAKLVSGNIAKGSWAAAITVGSGLPTGTYRVVINIAKLKGVKGALYRDGRSLTLTNSNATPKPTAESKINNSKSPKTQSKPTSSKILSISCIKGKITKMVTGVNPKCPVGYTKK